MAIAYDPEKLHELANSANTFYNYTQKAYQNIIKSTNDVSSSWEGEDAENALQDLTKVKEALDQINSNAEKAKNSLNTTANNFSEIHYNG